MNRIPLVPLALLMVFAAACAPSLRFAKSRTPDTAVMTALLAGRYHNQAQARRDPRVATTYLHIVPIWTQRKGHWLYWERRTLAPMGDGYDQRIIEVLPYRRRVFELRSYALPTPERFRGRWDRPEVFDRLTRDSLSANAGCSFYLRHMGGDYYRGGTRTFACLNADSTAFQAIDWEVQPAGIHWIQQWRDTQNAAIPSQSDSMVTELRRIIPQ